jgi:uncharacterized protein DUF6572
MLKRRKESGSGDETLFDATKVDLVAVSQDGKTVSVIVAQPGPWSGSDDQINSLQEKIHNYVGFALDGEMVRLYPETEGLAWNIGLDCHFGLPDTRTQQVLDQLRDAVKRYGGDLVVRVPAR